MKTYSCPKYMCIDYKEEISHMSPKLEDLLYCGVLVPEDSMLWQRFRYLWGVAPGL